MARIRTAIISVSDKTGAAEFAARLRALGIRIIATGGTARLLRERGVEVTDVSDYTGFPEILQGDLRTLHPKIHGAVLARRQEDGDLGELSRYGIGTIDMVVVNLFTFAGVVSDGGVELTRAVESVDIAGPALLRSAAKNYTHVAVVTDPRTYGEIADELERCGGCLSEEMHFRLAKAAFRHTAHYDTVIAEYLAGIHGEAAVGPERIALEFARKAQLRHGDNPHQQAVQYIERRLEEPSASSAARLMGPEPSLGDLLNAHVGVELVREFDAPTVATVKHGIPCAVACAESQREALERALSANRAGAERCTLVANRPFEVRAARALAKAAAQSVSVECLLAPGYEKGALDALRKAGDWVGNLRVLEIAPLDWSLVDERAKDLVRLTGGLVVQDRDLIGFDAARVRSVARSAPDQRQAADLEFAWLCCKHVRSRAAVLARDGVTAGIGAGQSSDTDAVRVALLHAGDGARGAVLASDGPLYSAEPVRLAAEAGVTAVIQPGGAQADADVAAAAETLGLPMLLTGVRHYRH